MIKKSWLELATKATDKDEIEGLILQINTFIKNGEFNPDLLHLRAELYTRLQQPHKAINDYNQILSQNKADKKAKVQLEILSTILRYNNTDIYSSTNTDMDPWLE